MKGDLFLVPPQPRSARASAGRTLRRGDEIRKQEKKTWKGDERCETLWWSRVRAKRIREEDKSRKGVRTEKMIKQNTGPRKGSA